MPKTFLGWVILVFIVMCFMFGIAGAFGELGSIYHAVQQGFQSFRTNARGG